MSSDEEEEQPSASHRRSSSSRRHHASSKEASSSSKRHSRSTTTSNNHSRRSKRSSRSKDNADDDGDDGGGGGGDKTAEKKSRRSGNNSSSRKPQEALDDSQRRRRRRRRRQRSSPSSDDDDDDGGGGDNNSDPDENIFTRGIPAPPLADGSNTTSSSGSSNSSNNNKETKRNKNEKKSRIKTKANSSDDDEASVSEEERRDGLGELVEYQDYELPIDKDDDDDYDDNDEALWEQVLDSFLTALESCEWQTLYLIMTRVPKQVLITLVDRQIIISEEEADSFALPVFHVILSKAPCGVSLHLLELLGDNEIMKQLCRMRSQEDGNTALHIFCANLDEYSHDPSGLVREHQLDLLSRLLDVAADEALKTPNAQGDSPLHLLVASQAATTTTSKTSTSSSVSVVEQAVSMFLQEVNDLAVAQDSSGATPLHVAIAHGAHESILIKLIQRGPLAVKVLDKNGLLPIHYCAAAAATFNGKDGRIMACLEALIRAHPAGLTTPTTSHGDTPLHLFISNCDASASSITNKAVVKATVELLMGKSSGASSSSPIALPNNEKLTPIHCCALFHVTPEITRTIMSHRSAKKASLMTNKYGATALHMAVSQEVIHMETIKALGVAREAAAAEDRLKRSPLHVAAQNTKGATDPLIRFLYSLYPDATAMRTQRGHLPLHLAAQSQPSKEVVQALLTVDASAAQVRNKSSNTPLHDAAKYQADESVVRLLLETYPDAIYVQNQYGNLPLHCATAYQASAGVISLLLEAWPDGAAMQNRNQDAPLHYAAAYYYTLSDDSSSQFQAMKRLIAAAPAAVLLLNSSGQSPLDRARANQAPDEIIELLEESADEWTKRASKEQWGDAAMSGGDDDDYSDDEDESE